MDRIKFFIRDNYFANSEQHIDESIQFLNTLDEINSAEEKFNYISDYLETNLTDPTKLNTILNNNDLYIRIKNTYKSLFDRIEIAQHIEKNHDLSNIEEEFELIDHAELVTDTIEISAPTVGDLSGTNIDISIAFIENVNLLKLILKELTSDTQERLLYAIAPSLKFLISDHNKLAEILKVTHLTHYPLIVDNLNFRLEQIISTPEELACFTAQLLTCELNTFLNLFKTYADLPITNANDLKNLIFTNTLDKIQFACIMKYIKNLDALLVDKPFDTLISLENYNIHRLRIIFSDTNTQDKHRFFATAQNTIEHDENTDKYSAEAYARELPLSLFFSMVL